MVHFVDARELQIRVEQDEGRLGVGRSRRVLWRVLLGRTVDRMDGLGGVLVLAVVKVVICCCSLAVAVAHKRVRELDNSRVESRDGSMAVLCCEGRPTLMHAALEIERQNRSGRTVKEVRVCRVKACRRIQCPCCQSGECTGCRWTWALNEPLAVNTRCDSLCAGKEQWPPQ